MLLALLGIAWMRLRDLLTSQAVRPKASVAYLFPSTQTRSQYWIANAEKTLASYSSSMASQSTKSQPEHGDRPAPKPACKVYDFMTYATRGRAGKHRPEPRHTS